MSSTGARTSLETSLSLVWLLNLGSGTFTLSTQHRPSRMSSPLTSTLAFLASSLVSMYLPITRVMAARRPVRVGAAVALRDVVGEAQHLFVVAVVPLHGHFHADFGAGNAAIAVGRAGAVA